MHKDKSDKRLQDIYTNKCKPFLREIKRSLIKWKTEHVHGCEDLMLLMSQLSLKHLPVQSQWKSNQDCRNWQADSEAYMRMHRALKVKLTLKRKI